jgi:hypothetical protein
VPITDLASLTVLSSRFTGNYSGACQVGTPGGETLLYSPATGATGGSDFRLVSGGFRFNWNTSTAQSTGKGCYTVIWQFNDGSAPRTKTVRLK